MSHSVELQSQKGGRGDVLEVELNDFVKLCWDRPVQLSGHTFHVKESPLKEEEFIDSTESGTNGEW